MLAVAREQKATIDFETRSTINLKQVGAWIYGKHKTTEAVVLSYRLPHWPEGKVKRWRKAWPNLFIEESEPPQELFDWIAEGGLVEAHNAFFEKCIWFHKMMKEYGWPEIPHLQWRCSASQCSAASLPRSLEGAVKAMHLPIEKDMDGRKLMLKMCKPRQMRKDEIAEWWEAEGKDLYPGDLKPRSKKDPRLPVTWHETVEDVIRQEEYCDRDVLAEECLSHAIPPLPPKELAIWQMDQRMNWTGVKFDLPMAEAALEMVDKWKARLNSELLDFTGIARATMRDQVKSWLLEHEDLDLPDTTAVTLDWYLDNGILSKRARRILNIVKQVNRTSVAKYKSMLKRADPDDGRAREMLMYAGAGTMRWTGKGVQVQNFPRGNCKNAFDGNKAYFSPEEAAELIMSGDIDWAYAVSGDVMEMLSTALRAAIIPGIGRDLIVADYSAIEARVVLWLAGAEKALEVFRTGGDIYCDMAEGIYGYPVSKATHFNERQFGKQAILGLGYGMGFLTFFLTCRKYKITFSVDQVKKIVGPTFDEQYRKLEAQLFPRPPKVKTAENTKRYRQKMRAAAKQRHQLTENREDPKKVIHELVLMKHTVKVYRDRYPEVKKLWKDQESAAIQAVEEAADHKLDGVQSGKIRWEVDLDDVTSKIADTEQAFLRCKLPSGRSIRYRSPKIKPVKTSWGETRNALRYMSTIIGGRWASTHTYGGKIVENITQAVARDIMAEAMLNSEPTCYDGVFTVHDELVAEVDEDKGSVSEFEELICELPAWADGCPIVAEGERYKRYRK